MQLSTRGRYAIMAMIDLSTLQNNRTAPTTLADIAQRQNISLSYLEQIFGKLRKAGVVHSVRGPGGGYTLARSPLCITLAEIIGAVDETTDATRCATGDLPGGPLAGKGCLRGQKCNAHDVWHALGLTVQNFFEGITLQHVLDGNLPRASVKFSPPAHRADAAPPSSLRN